jgi:Cation transporting ATPase, C-terminus
MSKHILG